MSALETLKLLAVVVVWFVLLIALSLGAAWLGAHS